MQKTIRYVSSAAIAVLLFGAYSVSLADTASINFENPPYTLGTINAQDGWSSFGAAGSGCAVYDHAVSSSQGTAGFGAQSLRVSDAVTSGCFGDQTFSKSLSNDAGEPTAQSSSYSGGTRQTHFEAQFDLASAVPGALQSGLHISVSPDRGDGARMSYLRFEDHADGVHVFFDDYQDAAPFGTLASPSLGCEAEDDFIESDIATLNRAVPHTIKFVIDFVNGPRNDVVKVYVDGVLKKTGTTWEDYFRWCTESGGGVPNNASADVSRAVDSLLFRSGGTAVPADLGKGFLFDNLSLLSSTPPDCSATHTVTFATAGSLTFTVPTYCSLTAQVWGGGGSGGTQYNQGTNGSASSFKGTLIGGGGATGRGAYGGPGGSASGGNTNIAGAPGQNRTWVTDGNGGSAPNGGAGGASASSPGTSGSAGGAPGGGGGGAGPSDENGFGGAGGGSGGYATKTYASGALTVGSNVAIVVGAGGADSSGDGSGGFGGSGGTGRVTITYTGAP